MRGCQVVLSGFEPHLVDNFCADGAKTIFGVNLDGGRLLVTPVELFQKAFNQGSNAVFACPDMWRQSSCSAKASG